MLYDSLDFKGVIQFKGGGGGQAQQIQSAPVPLPSPPVTANNRAVLQAEHDYAQANMQKKSVRKTIVAGDTGGYKKPPGAPVGPAGPASPQL